MTELSSERQIVIKALEALGIDAWVFEKDAGARAKSPQETYLEELQKADIYIGIFWKGYGDYTISEFEQSQQLGKPCLIYEKRMDIDNRDPELQAFLDEISQVEI